MKSQTINFEYFLEGQETGRFDDIGFPVRHEFTLSVTAEITPDDDYPGNFYEATITAISFCGAPLRPNTLPQADYDKIAAIAVQKWHDRQMMPYLV